MTATQAMTATQSMATKHERAFEAYWLNVVSFLGFESSGLLGFGVASLLGFEYSGFLGFDYGFVYWLLAFVADWFRCDLIP